MCLFEKHLEGEGGGGECLNKADLSSIKNDRPPPQHVSTRQCQQCAQSIEGMSMGHIRRARKAIEKTASGGQPCKTASPTGAPPEGVALSTRQGDGSFHLCVRSRVKLAPTP